MYNATGGGPGLTDLLGWQHIDTAPQNGTPVLGIAKNAKGEWLRPSVYVNYSGEWHLAHMPDTNLLHQPIMWQNLPEPPNATVRLVPETKL